MSNRDEFDDPKGADLLGSVGPKAAFFIVLIALSFMIGVVWKLYVGGGDANRGNVPVVRADTTPYKIDPEDPGGMEMPNKDSTIFSSLNSDPDDNGGVENLLAETTVEEPINRSELFAGLNTQASPELHAESQETPLDQPLSADEERIIEDVKEAEAIVTNLVEDGVDAVDAAENINAVEAVEETVKDSALEVAKKAEQERLAQEKLAQEKLAQEKLQKEKAAKKAEALAKIEADKKKVAAQKAAAEKAAAKKAQEAKALADKAKAEEAKKLAAASSAPQSLEAGNSYVQLASIKSRDNTAAEWQKLSAKYGAALSGYKYRVETADLGAKGVYYRIQAGPVSKAQAQRTCAAIKRIDPNGCLVK